MACVGILIASCQTMPNGIAPTTSTQNKTVAHALYTPLFDEIDHLSQLVDAGEAERAGTLYLERRTTFLNSNDPRKDALLSRLSESLNAKYHDDLVAAENALNALPESIKGDYQTVSELLRTAESKLNEYPSDGPLSDPLLRNPKVDTLGEKLAAKKATYVASSGEAFIAFDPFKNPDFFEAYPIRVDPTEVIATAAPYLERITSNADAATLTFFIEHYGRYLNGTNLESILDQKLKHAWMRNAGITNPTEMDKLALSSLAHRFGNGVWPDAYNEIGLVEATSPSLLRDGQIDFPVSIALDLPVEARKLSLDDLLEPHAPRFTIVFQVAQAKSSRRVLSLLKTRSKFLAGYEGMSSSSELRSSSPDYISDAEFAEEVDPTAIQRETDIIGRPKGFSQPIYYAYNFERARILARKSMTVDFYLIDRVAGTYIKSTADYLEDQRFEVPYRLARSDPNLRRYVQMFDSEKAVDEFEKRPADLRLTQLLMSSLNNRDQLADVADLATLRRFLQKDRNTAIANYRANVFEGNVDKDPRMQSVVAIYTGGGAMGSGFFVTPDVVLTNWHVVEESRFVELRTHDNRETYGTVLGKDVRLDVALVRVQERGKPVRFFQDQSINLGQTVDAIGHPRRLLFSITRGIISAVRKHPSINLPRNAGDEVLYVQTDAPVNPGNSGGPLFLDDYVIGMNTWGKAYADGLNFAVHYSELLAFMREHLPGFRELN